MKELDFDELDRAVNSLMSDAQRAKPEPKPDEDKTLTIDPTLGADDAPDFSQLTASAEKADSAQQAVVSESVEPAPVSALASGSSVAPASRRSGRFMDVVHPSSDMKKANVPTRPVSRQGLTIDPRPRTPEGGSTESAASERPAIEKTPVVSSQPSQKNEWPDPLDMAGYTVEPATASDEIAAEVPAADTISPGEPLEDSSTPLVSPFLTGAKVDKRPLGGASAELSAPEPDHTPTVDVSASENVTQSDPDAQLPAEPKAAVSLPEELRHDLVAIESGSHVLEADAGAQPESVVPEAVPAVSKPGAASAGPVSIPQQYKEEPNTGEPNSGAIYDTSTYHQPLAHPVNKKSGWMWVVWIVLILLVGAGAGAALYFLG